ncbi:MAG: TetR/AcrR family transcriptional regulator [Desulfatibacillaceae bacterium]
MPPIPELEETRRSQILLAAVKCLANHGCANVTMAEVAEAANLSKGGLTHYYPSKDELFKETFKEFFRRVFDRFQAMQARVDDPEQRLYDFELLFDPVETADEIGDPETSLISLGYPLLYDCMFLAAHDPEYRDLFEEWVDEWIRLLKRALEDGVRSGVFREMDTEAVARTISAVYQGVATRWFLAPRGHSISWATESYRKAIEGLMLPYKINP